MTIRIRAGKDVMNDQNTLQYHEPTAPSSGKPNRDLITCAIIFGAVIVTLLLLGIIATILVGPGLLAELYERAGIYHVDQGEFERAIHELDLAVKLSPNSVSAYYYRGEAYEMMGDTDHAIDDYSKTIALDPEFTDAYFGRGYIYIEIEDYNRAVADYDRVLELNPDSALAYNNRCWSYFKMGEYEQALPDCEKSIELRPDNVAALDSRARVYSALGYIEEAISDFERIIELDLDPDLSQYAIEQLRELQSP